MATNFVNLMLINCMLCYVLYLISFLYIYIYIYEVEVGKIVFCILSEKKEEFCRNVQAKKS